MQISEALSYFAEKNTNTKKWSANHNPKCYPVFPVLPETSRNVLSFFSLMNPNVASLPLLSNTLQRE